MFTENLTARDFLKFRSSESLGGAVRLTKEQRYAQAEFAKTCRNFWFTASARPQSTVTGAGLVIIGQTPRFSEPVIITDILAMFDFKSDDATVSAMVSRFFLQIKQFGSGDAVTGRDIFGLINVVGQEFITKHEKNRSTTVSVTGPVLQVNVFDTQSKWLAFVPRLLKPYDFIQAQWGLNAALDNLPEESAPLQLGFRAVRTFAVDSPYRYILGGPAAVIKNHISGNEPELFLLEVSFPIANMSAVGSSVPLVLKTPQMGRPLLILGAASNVEGCQGSLTDEDSYYRFTYIDKIEQPVLAATQPVYQAPPLSLWAPNTDFRNNNMVNMWPVPHLLEPGAQLRIELFNGLYPIIAIPGSYQESAATRSNQKGRITFICRTV